MNARREVREKTVPFKDKRLPYEAFQERCVENSKFHEASLTEEKSRREDIGNDDDRYVARQSSNEIYDKDKEKFPLATAKTRYSNVDGSVATKEVTHNRVLDQ